MTTTGHSALISIRRTGQYSDEDAVIITTKRGDAASHTACLRALAAAGIETALARTNHAKITFDPAEMSEDDAAAIVEGVLGEHGITVSRGGQP